MEKNPLMIVSCGYVSPLGPMRITATEEGVREIVFTETLCPDPPRGDLVDCIRWLDEYFAGKNPRWRPRVAETGTPFQRAVWARVDAIPYGRTVSYASLGSCPRAIGGAVGKNPLAILRPCHRVIGASGELKGYAWGVEKKIWLLDFERGLTTVCFFLK